MPDPHAPGPFAFADPQRVESILSASGFGEIKVTPHSPQLSFGRGGSLRETVAELLAIGPVSRLLVDQPQEVIDRIVDDAAQTMAPHYREGKLILAGAVWFVTAKAAGQ
jgi:hypothetical protein